MDDLQNDGLALGVFEAFDRSGGASLVLDEFVRAVAVYVHVPSLAPCIVHTQAHLQGLWVLGESPFIVQWGHGSTTVCACAPLLGEGWGCSGPVHKLTRQEKSVDLNGLFEWVQVHVGAAVHHSNGQS